MDYLVLGDNIRKARKAVKLTQEKLSEYVDLSPAFISQIERGTRKPGLETVYAISVIVGVSVDDLLKCVSADKENHESDKISIMLKNRTRSEINLATLLVEKLLDSMENGKLTEN